MAKQRLSVEQFINTGKSSGGAGTEIEFSEFRTGSGVGGGIWKKTGNTGSPSQQPITTNDVTFFDSSGEEWLLVYDGEIFGEQVGIGGYLDDAPLISSIVALRVENQNVKFKQLKPVTLLTQCQIGSATDSIISELFINETTCDSGSGYKFGSATSYIKRSNLLFGRVAGTGKRANDVDLLTIEAVAQSYIHANDIVDCRNGVYITPAIACGDNRAYFGRIGGAVNGIHFDNSVNLGGGHAQNFQCNFGLILTCDYGIRKTINLAGSPMDLSYFKGALDFNVVNDVLDNQPDSKSTYDLMFSDDGGAYVTQSLAGVGIDTSFVIKHYRGVGSDGMFIGIGNEKAGLLKYGNQRVSADPSDGDHLIVNSESRTPGTSSFVALTHSDADGLTNVIDGAYIESFYISDTNVETYIGVQTGGVRKRVLRLLGSGAVVPATNGGGSLGTDLLRYTEAHLETRLFIGGNQVLTTQQPAISDSVGGDEQAKINSILSALRAHGIIDK